MNNKLIIIGASLMAAVLPAAADQLTPDQALSRAASVRYGVAGFNKQSVNTIPVATGHSDGVNTYYVFDKASADGFVVIAADDAVDATVLGYSDNGRFIPGAIPPALQYMLDFYNNEIGWAASNPDQIVKAPRRVDASDYHDIAPILETTWDQGSPYYNLCPEIGGQHTYVGCVATAMAQIMKHHNWPEHGYGSNTYRVQSIGRNVTVDFSESVYEWDNMLPSYRGTSTSAQKAAVARLSYDCGVSVNMQYDLSGSGAVSNYVGGALNRHFGYDLGMTYVQRNYYYIDEWIALLYNELAEGRPLYYAGSAPDGGHAFVIDGFRTTDNFFHVNWGWNGMSDGYFRISSLNPENQGIGGASGGFSEGQEAWIGIRPAQEGSKVVPQMLALNKFTVMSKSYTRTSSAQAQFFGSSSYAQFANYSIQAITCQMGVQLTNEATGEVTYVASSTAASSYNIFTGGSRINVRASSFPQTGTYIVKPAFLFDGEWYEMPQPVTSTQVSLKLTATADRLEFADMPRNAALTVESFNAPDEVYTNALCHATALVKTEGAGIYTDFALKLTNVAGTRTYATVAQDVLDIAEDNTVEVDLSGFLTSASTVTDGTECKLVLTYGSGNGTVLAEKTVVYHTNEVACTVNSVVPESTSGTGTQFRPYRFPVDQFSATVEISCTSGFFCERINGAFLSTGGTVLGILHGDVLTLNEGETGAITISGNPSDLIEVNKIYMFTPYSPNMTSELLKTVYVRAEASGITELGPVDDTQLSVVLAPGSDALQVVAASALRRVELYSTNGALAMTADGNGASDMQLGVGAIAPGIYVVRALTDNGVFTARVVKK